ncbi:MAG: hypothetical protein JWO06_2229 [Bacteroidota bacterium]|nr:hypothetical protein [Bacteroidota bacterium]
MKFVAVILFACLFIRTNGQDVYLGLRLGPNVTLPLGSNNRVFWRFPEDSSTVYNNVKSKKYLYIGATINPDLKMVFRSNREVKFALETGLLYYFKAYKISWSADYSSPASSGSIYASYKIKRHEVGFNVLPGFVYRNWCFETGLNFLFTASSTTEIQFIKQGAFYINEKTNDLYVVKPGILTISLPVFLSYSISINHSVHIAPFISYEFELSGWDGYALGNLANRRQISLLSEFIAGISFQVLLKQQK